MPKLNELSTIILNIWNDVNNPFALEFNALQIVIDCHIENPHRLEKLAIIRGLSSIRSEMDSIAKEKQRSESDSKNQLPLKSNIPSQ